MNDQLAIINLSSAPVTLNVYAAEVTNSADGSLAVAPSSDEPTDVAGWVSFQAPGKKGYVKVGGRETVIVPFKVNVPKNASVGDHLAGVVVAAVTSGATPGERGTDVRLEQRIAIRLGLRVAGELAPGLAVENVTASYGGSLNPFGAGVATVSYTVRNTGNVRLAGAQTVTVAGLAGAPAVAASLNDVPLLLPGNSATYTVPVQDVRPFGPMTATVEIIPLAVAGDANPPSEVATSSVVIWAVPWLLLALILVVVLAVLASLRLRRSRTGGSSSTPRSRRVSEPVA